MSWHRCSLPSAPAATWHWWAAGAGMPSAARSCKAHRGFAAWEETWGKPSFPTGVGPRGSSSALSSLRAYRHGEEHAYNLGSRRALWAVPTSPLFPTPSLCYSVTSNIRVIKKVIFFSSASKVSFKQTRLFAKPYDSVLLTVRKRCVGWMVRSISFLLVESTFTFFLHITAHGSGSRALRGVFVCLKALFPQATAKVGHNSSGKSFVLWVK